MAERDVSTILRANAMWSLIGLEVRQDAASLFALLLTEQVPEHRNHGLNLLVIAERVVADYVVAMTCGTMVDMAEAADECPKLFEDARILLRDHDARYSRPPPRRSGTTAIESGAALAVEEPRRCYFLLAPR